MLVWLDHGFNRRYVNWTANKYAIRIVTNVVHTRCCRVFGAIADLNETQRNVAIVLRPVRRFSAGIFVFHVVPFSCYKRRNFFLRFARHTIAWISMIDFQRRQKRESARERERKILVDNNRPNQRRSLIISTDFNYCPISCQTINDKTFPPKQKRNETDFFFISKLDFVALNGEKNKTNRKYYILALRHRIRQYGIKNWRVISEIFAFSSIWARISCFWWIFFVFYFAVSSCWTMFNDFFAFKLAAGTVSTNQFADWSARDFVGLSRLERGPNYAINMKIQKVF